jgi:hypothetical protein
MTVFQTGWRKISELCLLWCGMWWRSFWVNGLKAGRSRGRFPLDSLEFFIDIILPAALWPWGRLSLKHNGYQEYFLGCKGSRCLEPITLPLSCASCLKFWEPQFSEAQRACTGLNRDCFYLLLVEVGGLSVFEHASALPSRTNYVCDCQTKFNMIRLFLRVSAMCI